MGCTLDFSSESQAVVKRAGKDVQLGHGSFVGKLSVEFGFEEGPVSFS